MDTLEEPHLRPRAARIVGEAWRIAFQRGGRATLAAISIALAGAAIAFVALHRFDVSGVAVQIAVAVLVLVAGFIAALVVIAARLERERDQLRRDLAVCNRRAFVHTTMAQIVGDLRAELDRDGSKIPPTVPGQYVDRALSAARSDRFASGERLKELEALQAPALDGSARSQLRALEQLLVVNLERGLYLRG